MLNKLSEVLGRSAVTVIKALFLVGGWVVGFLFLLLKYALGEKAFHCVLEYMANEMAPMVMQRGARLQQMMAHDSHPFPSETELWAQGFVEMYGYGPEPDRVSELLEVIRGSQQMRLANGGLPTAGAILALAEKHPDMAGRWQADFPDLFAEANASLIRCGEDMDQPGWSDYYMSRWLILQDEDSINQIRSRTTLDGVVGEQARWMAQSMAFRHPHFRQALGWDAGMPPLLSANTVVTQLNSLEGATILSVAAGEKPDGESEILVVTTAGMFRVGAKLLAFSLEPIQPQPQAQVDAEFTEDVTHA
jgi:hypothetical protein